MSTPDVNDKSKFGDLLKELHALEHPDTESGDKGQTHKLSSFDILHEDKQQRTAASKPDDKRPEEKKPEAKTATPPKPPVEPAKDNSSFTWGLVKGSVKEVGNMVSGVWSFATHTDDEAVNAATMRGDTSGSDFSFANGLKDIASKSVKAVGYINQHGWLNTIHGAISQTAADYKNASSEQKGEMWGHGVTFASTLVLGTGLLKSASKAGKLSETAEAATALGKLADVEELTAASRFAGLSRDARLLDTAGAISKEGRLVRTAEGLADTKFLTRPAIIDDLAGSKVLKAGDELKLETKVTGLTKDVRSLEELAGEGSKFKGLKLDAAGSGKLEKLFAEADQTVDVLNARSKAAHGLADLEKTDAGAAASLKTHSQSLQDAIKAFKTAESDPARLNALENLRTTALKYDLEVEANPITRARAAEFKLPSRTLQELDAANPGKMLDFQGSAPRFAARADETASIAETKSTSLSRQMQNARELTAGTPDALRFEGKIADVQNSVEKVRSAQSAIDEQAALAQYRKSIAEYNKLLETTPATAAKAGDLKIADTTASEFEAAAAQANRARWAANESQAVEDAARSTTAINKKLQEAEKVAANSSSVEDAAAVRQKAAEVDNGIQKVQASADAATREQRLAELQQQIQAYNDALPAAARTARISESEVAEFSRFSRQAADAAAAANDARNAVAAGNVVVEARDVAAAGRAAQDAGSINLTAGRAVEDARSVNLAAGNTLEDAGKVASSAGRSEEFQAARSLGASDTTALRGATAADTTALSKAGTTDAATAGSQALQKAQVQLDAHAEVMNLKLGKASEIISASGSEAPAMALKAQADLIRGDLQALRIATAETQSAVMADLRKNVAAYNYLVDNTPGLIAQAKDLRVSHAEVAQLQQMMREVQSAKLGAADVPSSMSTREVFGKSANTAPLSGRADGLAAITDPTGLRSGWQRFDRAVSLSLGTYFLANDLQSGLKGTLERIVRLANDEAARNQMANSQAAGQSGLQPNQSGQSAARGGDTGRTADATKSGAVDNAAAQMLSKPATADMTLSPAMQAFGLPRLDAQVLPSTAALRAEQEKEARYERVQEAKEAFHRRANQFGVDWYGPHVYLKGVDAPVTADYVVLLPPPRLVASTPDRGPQRNVTPQFDLSYIRRFTGPGTARGARGDGTLLALSGSDSKGSGRGMSLKDQKNVPSQFAFLMTHTGEAVINSGNKGVQNIENREQQDLGKLSGGAGGAQPPAAALTFAAVAGAPVSHSDPQHNQNATAES